MNFTTVLKKAFKDKRCVVNILNSDANDFPSTFCGKGGELGVLIASAYPNHYFDVNGVSLASDDNTLVFNVVGECDEE